MGAEMTKKLRACHGHVAMLQLAERIIFIEGDTTRSA
jgi:hypothetical protein